MATFSRTTFVFRAEHGARLRELRRRHRLTLRDLALLMDRTGGGAYSQLARLERGDVKSPSLNLVADYLRACGAGFRDLLDLLDGYTSRKPVLTEKGDKRVQELLKSLPGPEQRAMLKWEKAVTEVREEKAAAGLGRRKGRVQTDRERINRIIWSFIHANWNEVVELKLYEALVKLGDKVKPSERRDACRAGRRMFGVMARHYATESRRKRALALVEKRAKDAGYSQEVISTMLEAAANAFTELERSGRLEWEPTEDEVIKARGHAPKVEKAETRMELAATGPGMEYFRMLNLVKAMTGVPVIERLEKLRLDENTRRAYHFWVDHLVDIAVAHGSDSDEWQRDVEETAARSRDGKLVRAMAALAAEAFEVWKVKLPAKPEA